MPLRRDLVWEIIIRKSARRRVTGSENGPAPCKRAEDLGTAGASRAARQRKPKGRSESRGLCAWCGHRPNSSSAMHSDPQTPLDLMVALPRRSRSQGLRHAYDLQRLITGLSANPNPFRLSSRHAHSNSAGLASASKHQDGWTKIPRAFRPQTLSAASTPYQSLLGTHRASESKKTKKWDHFASQLIALCRAEARLPAAWGKGGQRSGIGKANTAGRGAVGVPQLGGARFALFFSRQLYICRQFAIQQNVADPLARNEAAGWWTGWRQSIHGSDHLACALWVAADPVGSELESVGFATRFVLCRLFRFETAPNAHVALSLSLACPGADRPRPPLPTGFQIVNAQMRRRSTAPEGVWKRDPGPLFVSGPSDKVKQMIRASNCQSGRFLGGSLGGFAASAIGGNAFAYSDDATLSASTALHGSAPQRIGVRFARFCSFSTVLLKFCESADATKDDTKTRSILLMHLCCTLSPDRWARKLCRTSCGVAWSRVTPKAFKSLPAILGCSAALYGCPCSR
ncbi:hypothetical protein L1887_57185 [Cichorium endivia]|nr:hypothetical protein L1887_57185 [Cichorium endivia]